MKRLIGLVLLAILAFPSVALAGGPWVDVHGDGSVWRDPACTQTPLSFDVRMYRDVNYQGTMWRVCSETYDFCHYPSVDSAGQLACDFGISNWRSPNDKVSSMKVIHVYGGPSCRVTTFVNNWYSGQATVDWDPIAYSTLHPAYGDKLSSIRKTC